MANTKIPVELSSTPGIVDGSNATAITINSNEQVGLGTTPPTDTHATWSQFFIGQKGSLISEKSGTGGIYGTILSDNLYIDSDTGSPANIVTNESSAYIQEAGSHKFYSQASGSAGAAVTLSEKMQIDSSGNAIFTKSGGAYLQLKDASAVRGAINVQTSDGLVFTTGSSFAERMRINDAGDVLIGGTQEYNTLNGRGNLVVGSGSGNEGITIVTGTSNTGGINFADGTSGDAAYRGYIEYRHDLDAFVFGTSATERMRLDSSGNLGIGITSPSSYYSKELVVAASDNGGITLVNSDTSHAAYLMFADGTSGADAYRGQMGYDHNNNSMFFSTDSTLRLMIDSSGRVNIGATASTGQAGTIFPQGYRGRQGVGGTETNTFNLAFQASGATQVWIDYTNIGNLTVSSDYRIKRNIETQTADALTRVKQIRPVTYQRAKYQELFEQGDEVKEGFIAHELAEIIPSAVEGEKDSSNQIQSLNLDALCSVLTKAIQEQQELIETQQTTINDLKSRIETLEGGE